MADDDELSALIRQQATRHRAPDALRAAIRTQAALAEAGRERRRWTWPLWLAFSPGWRGAAAGFAAGLAMALWFGPLWHAATESGLPGDEPLVAMHVAALGDGPLVQVVSSDRHTVKPWFQGRIDYAPPVVDLAEAGFPLQGGRVWKWDGKPRAVLVYQRRLHVIELFVWPQARRQPMQASTWRGFHVLRWADGGMGYAAVSDVDAAELTQFGQQWGQHTTPTP